MDQQQTKHRKRKMKSTTQEFSNNNFPPSCSLISIRRLLSIDEKLWSVTTVEKMKALYNNYEQDTAINEYVSPIERKEEEDFLDAVLATPVVK
jgi:Endoribonuclease XendoU